MMMEERERIAKRNTFLGINLGLILVCIGSLILLIIFYPLALGKDSTVLALETATSHPFMTSTFTPYPTETPTPTNTNFPTFTPTITFTPTWTEIPTLTPTPPGPPTLTPARPLVLSGNYDLVPWSPERADFMIQLMNDFPNTLAGSERGEDNRAYFQASEYAVTAQKEAILRYPDDPLADSWRWGLAYNLARVGDHHAGQQYAELIVQALNRGETEISYLYAWFPEREPRMTLHMVELAPPSGYLASYLLEIRGSGSSFIWLLQSSSGFRAYPLLTNFNFVHNPQADWIVTDINGDPDDGKEVAIYFSNLPGEFWLNPPHVFNLNQIPPKELPFLPAAHIFNVGMDFENNWVVIPNQDGSSDLLFRSAVFPACPVTLERQFHWNGQFFGFVADRFVPATDIKTPSYCQTIVDHAANTWGPAATIAIMEPLLPDWPPEKDSNGQSYPLDAPDEWRYRLGIYHALLGNDQIARRYLFELVSTPTVATSQWVKPAREFLEIYQLPDDLYRACLPAQFCNPSVAIQTLVSQILPTGDVLNELRAFGVDTSSSGFFDFDDDEEAERWFTVRYRSRTRLNYWILAAYSLGYRGLNVGQVDSTGPTLEYLEDVFIQEDALHLQPAVILDRKVAFSMQRLPDTQEPYLVEVPLRKEYPNRFLAGVAVAEQALFLGQSPAQVQDELSNLAYNPGLLCAGTWSCDYYYYLLGLSGELAGDTRGAVDAYHRLWLDYSRSPYTTMARLKLSGGVFVSPTPTPSRTPVGTSLVTVTQTATPVPTVTGTPPETATTAPTATSSGGYPGPATNTVPPYP